MVPDNWNFNGSNPCLYHGGNYNQNQNHGPFYVNYNRTSNSNDNIGCRILAEPQANPPFGSRGSSPFLYRTVDRTALAEEKPILDRHYQPKTMFALKKVVRKECRRLQALYPPYQAA